jgi:hypothetical protein
MLLANCLYVGGALDGDHPCSTWSTIDSASSVKVAYFSAVSWRYSLKVLGGHKI